MNKNKKASELEALNSRLKEFAVTALNHYWGLKEDDFCLAKEAELLGLVEYVRVDEPCGDACTCQDFGAEFPVECCRTK